MVRIRLILTLCCSFISIAALQAQPIYVGEFNILKVESFDIFGTQEVLHNQLEDLLAALPDYEYVGVGRNDGMTEGEYASIFYKTDSVKCLSSGHFWLSETPEVVGSVSKSRQIFQLFYAKVISKMLPNLSVLLRL